MMKAFFTVLALVFGVSFGAMACDTHDKEKSKEKSADEAAK